MFKDPSGKTMEGDSMLSESERKQIDLLSKQWINAKSDKERYRINKQANEIRARYLAGAILINSEDAVQAGDVDLGHNGIIFLTKMGQGFYFSFGPTTAMDINQLEKLIVCDGQMEFKVLSPTEVKEFEKKEL